MYKAKQKLLNLIIHVTLFTMVEIKDINALVVLDLLSCKLPGPGKWDLNAESGE